MGINPNHPAILAAIERGLIETPKPVERPQPAFRTEKEFQSAVVELAKSGGWEVYHTYDSRRSEPGYPDLTMLRGRSIVVAELKVEPNKPTAAQEKWLAAWKLTDAEVYVWYPSSWREIVARLRETGK